MNAEQIERNLEVLAEAEGGIPKLRELILQLAMMGRLVEQTPLADQNSATWRTVKLSTVALSMQNGISKRHASDGVPTVVIRLSDIKNRSIVDTDLRCVPLTSEEIDKYILAEGDLLIIRVNGSSSLVGRFIPCRKSLLWAYCDHFIRLKILVDLINSEYLCLVSNTPAFRSQVESVTVSTAGQRTVNQKGLGDIQILLPSVAEQKRIVAKVDELMALCDELERRQERRHSLRRAAHTAALDALTQAATPEELERAWGRLKQHWDLFATRADAVPPLRQAILQLAVQGRLVRQEAMDAQAFDSERGLPAGWQSKRFCDLADVISGVTKGRNLIGRDLITVPYLRVANVQGGWLDLSVMKDIEIPKEELVKYRLHEGDVVLTEGGDWDKLGRSAIWRSELDLCIHQNHVFRARIDRSKATSEWISMFTNSPVGRRYFQGCAKQTTNLASINMAQLRSCPMPIPPLAEQKRIVAKVDELMSLCDELERRARGREEILVRAAQAAVGAMTGAGDGAR